ncbi:hypothetical protein UCRPC4_g03265 [Phaeomoniella chlamydospora]|uniref:alpha-galactosidase n=1 Tax=Phaeomoniella chlamydospora TaxID=158046 RepID=A0A0G2EIG9_PHACM|nr:hypothetical protein UCRPC4_g03265 [Phaeomoniella chlamydospora]
MDTSDRGDAAGDGSDPFQKFFSKNSQDHGPAEFRPTFGANRSSGQIPGTMRRPRQKVRILIDNIDEEQEPLDPREPIPSPQPGGAVMEENPSQPSRYASPGRGSPPDNEQSPSREASPSRAASPTRTATFIAPPKVEQNSEPINMKNMFKQPTWQAKRETPSHTTTIDFANWNDSDDENGSTSAGSSKGSSTLFGSGGMSVSQKMMEKLNFAEDNRGGGSFATTGSFKPLSFATVDEKKKRVAPVKKKKRKPIYPWYSPKRYSTRRLILFGAGIFVFVILVIVLSVTFVEKAKKAASQQEKSTWKPSPGSTWEIQLSSQVAHPTYTTAVYDIDLFDTPASTIEQMHNLGRRVVCYFSAGTLEKWRTDAKEFPADAIGEDLAGWDEESYLDIRSSKVRQIMAKRIALAKTKGCDGVDPDNVDAYASNATGFRLTASDAVGYLKFLADEAHDRLLSIGLKNAPLIADQVINDMDWAITESCVPYQECDYYHSYIEAGRAVFHLEYVDGSAQPINQTFSVEDVLHTACNGAGTNLFSTLVKKTSLDEWFLSCPLGNPNYRYF